MRPTTVRVGRVVVLACALCTLGLYGVSSQGTTLRRPGFAIGFGVDAPFNRRQTDPRHFIQIDFTLHVINIGEDAPLAAMTASPNVSILFGWAYRFRNSR